MTDEDATRRPTRAERLFGAAAQPSTRPPRAPGPEAPVAVRRAALVAAVEAALLLGTALVVLWLTLTSDPDSVGRALAEVVYVGGFGVALAVAAAGLRRVAGWARGPVVVLQILLGLFGYSTAFPGQQPLLGIPLIVLALTELYLLATPEARLAFADR
ncbi:hypothetical protein SAMN05660464_1500 [Geodermatophilus dictyosporus]|uniref:Uncharacterized protein n=1 Tax=Geodermatophilus dictyosporus TaxID=1523247 RepID=A0A1I5L2E9_9ACTN|nr:hypothetical protein [Geodermatophilus dictyosporus]SFO91016.1 hypothetical protein SAMN05660464_1500 [Geodermatophilus dictyosporus]